MKNTDDVKELADFAKLLEKRRSSVYLASAEVSTRPSWNFLAGLPEDVQLRLRRITDPYQRSTLLDSLRRGLEISDFVWEPIANFEGAESSEFRPESYWSASGEPLVGSHTYIRMPYVDVGEYLPDLLPGEVEIARIVLKSSTGDVVSIRARANVKRITYRVVDEYETSFNFEPRESAAPLTLKEILDMIDGLEDDKDGPPYVWGVLEMNFGDDKRDDAPNFLSVPHSSAVVVTGRARSHNCALYVDGCLSRTTPLTFSWYVIESGGI
ncbi:MAG: hypothetical protein H0V18_14700 [Pyrinomonadaceae bacterium]|nr:hypothetical protein [Pyrinomonadaceae bacterium]